jgi:hypothetical protein
MNEKLWASTDELAVDHATTLRDTEMNRFDFREPLLPMLPWCDVHDILSVKNCQANFRDKVCIFLVGFDVDADKPHRAILDKRCQLLRVSRFMGSTCVAISNEWNEDTMVSYVRRLCYGTGDQDTAARALSAVRRTFAARSA